MQVTSGMWHTPVFSALGNHMQKEYEFQARPSDIQQALSQKKAKTKINKSKKSHMPLC